MIQNYTLTSFIYATILVLTISSTLILLVLILLSRTTTTAQRHQQKQKQEENLISIAFFHPYCDGGGGGERVLWTAIQALLEENTIIHQHQHIQLYIYARKQVGNSNELLTKVKKQFNISINPKSLELVYLNKTDWLEAKRYGFMTLILQSLGSMIVGWEALTKFKPSIFIETTGFAFISPIAKFFACHVISYVHYPTISTDMLRKVESRIEDYNNMSLITKSNVLTQLKLCYYQVFALLYGWVGSFADHVMVNSTWTLNHINEIWNIPERTHIVYPPCDFTSLETLPIDKRENLIISVAQFRPEKAHPLQIKAFSQLLKAHPELRDLKLVLIGTCRNDDDAARVKLLKEMVAQHHLEDRVIFEVDAVYEKLREYLERGLIGLHSMWNEHFGISIVEYMAAGLTVVAHNSGGPKSDIVTDSDEHGLSGFLATTTKDFADAMYRATILTPLQRRRIIHHARLKTRAFSNQTFQKSFLAPIIQQLDYIK